MNPRKDLVIFSDLAVEAAITRAVKRERGDIIAELQESGLKGRGGAGFPTGTKWALAGKAKGDRKFVICNADEGEPGTFKDRVLLSDYAAQLYAGMVVAAHAIGAREGIIYLRGEYEYLMKDLIATRKSMRAKHLLGKNVGGLAGFDFDVYIHLGSGAYVCGEESALIESLEGHRGEPRNRPPFPVTFGYLGCPTVVNNVETFITALHIVEKGSDWFKRFGTNRSTGTKLFSVSGDCAKPGVYEFPMGITIKALLDEVGGKDAKAVQVGGASGRCVGRESFGAALAFEDIPTGGSVIVFGPQRSMLEVARNFMEFFVEESCGQCTPCRYGTTTLLEGIQMLEERNCSMRYLRELVSLGETMQIASKCGLGQTAPNAFISILETFKHEILAGRPAEKSE